MNFAAVFVFIYSAIACLPDPPIPCLYVGFSPAGGANAIGCLEIQNPDCTWLGRMITCHDGYYAIAPSTASITVAPYGPFGGCFEINQCAAFGNSGKPAQVTSCSQPAVNERIICCATNYYPSGASEQDSCITLVGGATFDGCLLVDECALNGYDGKAANTLSCVSGLNQRTITCAAGYCAIAPTTASITLIGNAGFGGCLEIDTCEAYGLSGNTANVAGCAQTSVNTRTITCNPGYGVVGGPSTPPPELAVTLTGAATFPGCTLLNLCTIYGYSGNTAHTLSCTPGINTRTITCAEGYYPTGAKMVEGLVSITLVGATTFAGCSEENLCTVYGYSGRPDFTSSCVPGDDTRTVTCLPGYHATGATPADNPSITLKGPAPFLACDEIDNCLAYGYSGNRANTLACESDVNKRTITCDEGYYGMAPSSRTVTLTGNATFMGCFVTDMCKVYGFSNMTDNTLSCTSAMINERNITCQPGYYPLGGPSYEQSILLVGTSPFQGCKQVDECATYGYSGNANSTKSCVNSAVNKRTITCLDGYAAIAPNTTSITLTGGAYFRGCSKIDTCAVYGSSNHSADVESCNQTGVNQRTVLCNDGWSVTGYPGLTPQVTLIGAAVFPGCTEVDMCKQFGFSGKTDNTVSCLSGIDNRTITCARGYHVMTYESGRGKNVTDIPPPGATPFTIIGYENFDGCLPYCGDGILTPGEECDTGYHTTDPNGGCINCTISAGFVCGDEGTLCCFAGSFYSILVNTLKLSCNDSWWTSPLTNNTISFSGISSDSSSKRADSSDSSSSGSVTMDTGYLKLCGHITISQQFTINNNATLFVAGPIDVEGGTLTLQSGGTSPLIVIREPCKAWTDAPLGNNLNDSGLVIDANSTIEIQQVSDIIVNPYMNVSMYNDTPALVPFVDAHGCTEVYGTFRYDASEIPQQNNYIPFSYAASWTNCTFNVNTKEVTYTLPSCPIIWMYRFESQVNIGTATHRLCAGAVAGLSVGLGSAAIIGGGAAAGMAAGGGGAGAAATSPYVAL